jgi:hypothetical protein
LCDFSGAVEQRNNGETFVWNEATHLRLQEHFEDYLKKAEEMFNGQGLASVGENRWRRALLTIGDFMLPSGRMNWSFLINAATEPSSWKRLLRGSGPHVPEKRPLLKQLWDRLATNRSFKQQLDEIIAAATALEPWIEAFVRTPAALDYCERQSIRWISETQIYLLSKSQMNGSHAELFSYCLYHNVLRTLDNDGSLRPLKLSHYQSVVGADEEPYIPFHFTHQNQQFLFYLEFMMGNYYMRINRSTLQAFPEIHNRLRDVGGFGESEFLLTKTSAPDAIKDSLINLARLLATIDV